MPSPEVEQARAILAGSAAPALAEPAPVESAPSQSGASDEVLLARNMLGNRGAQVELADRALLRRRALNTLQLQQGIPSSVANVEAAQQLTDLTDRQAMEGQQAAQAAAERGAGVGFAGGVGSGLTAAGLGLIPTEAGRQAQQELAAEQAGYPTAAKVGTHVGTGLSMAPMLLGPGAATTGALKLGLTASQLGYTGASMALPAVGEVAEAAPPVDGALDTLGRTAQAAGLGAGRLGALEAGLKLGAAITPLRTVRPRGVGSVAQNMAVGAAQAPAQTIAMNLVGQPVEAALSPNFDPSAPIVNPGQMAEFATMNAATALLGGSVAARQRAARLPEVRAKQDRRFVQADIAPSIDAERAAFEANAAQAEAPAPESSAVPQAQAEGALQRNAAEARVLAGLEAERAAGAAQGAARQERLQLGRAAEPLAEGAPAEPPMEGARDPASIALQTELGRRQALSDQLAARRAAELAQVEKDLAVEQQDQWWTRRLSEAEAEAARLSREREAALTRAPSTPFAEEGRLEAARAEARKLLPERIASQKRLRALQARAQQLRQAEPPAPAAAEPPPIDLSTPEIPLPEGAPDAPPAPAVSPAPERGSLPPAPVDVGGRGVRLPEVRVPGPGGGVRAAEPAPGGSPGRAPEPAGGAGRGDAVPVAPVAPLPAKPGTALGGYLGNKASMWTAAKDMAGKIGNAFARPVDLLKGSTKRLIEPFGGSGIHGAYFKRAMPGVSREIGDYDPIVHEIHRRAKNEPDALAAEVSAVAERWSKTILDIKTARDSGATEDQQKAIAEEFAKSLEGNAAGEIARHAVGDVSPAGAQASKWYDDGSVAAASKIRAAAESVKAHSRELAGDTVTPAPADAREALARAGAGDTVILDPPYIDTAGYRAGEDMSKLTEAAVTFIERDVAAALKRGAHIIYTNAPHPQVVKALQRIGLHTDIVWVRSHGGRKRHPDDPQHPDPSKNEIGEQIGERPEVVAYSDPSRDYSQLDVAAPPAVRPGEPGKPGEPGAAAPSGGPSPAEPARPRLTPEAQKAEDQALARDMAHLLGPKATATREGDTLILEGNGRRYEIHRPDEIDVRSPEAWFDSALSNGVARLEAALNVAGVSAPGLRKALRDGQVEIARRMFLEKMNRKDREAVINHPKNRPVAMIELTGGRSVDAGRILRVKAALEGMALSKALAEEIGHDLWVESPEALRRRVIAEGASKAERAAIEAQGLDGGTALEVGTRIVSQELQRQRSKGQALPAWVQSAARFFAKWAAKLPVIGRIFVPAPKTAVQTAAERWQAPAEGGAAVRPPGPGEAYALKTPAGAEQAIRQGLAADQPGTTVDKVRAEADAIAADPKRFGDAYDRMERGDAVTEAEVVAMRDAALSSLGPALDAGGPQGIKAFEDFLAFTRATNKALSAAGTMLRMAQLDLRRPEDVQRHLLTTLANTGNVRWRAKLLQAKTPEAKAKVQAEWAKARKQIIDAVFRKTGVDLLDPEIGQTFRGQAFAIGGLTAAIERSNPLTLREQAADFARRATVGGLISELVRGNILTSASWIPQAATAAVMFPARALAYRTTDAVLAAIKKREVGGWEGSGEALKAAAAGTLESAALAIASLRAGKSLGREALTGRVSTKSEGETQSTDNDRAILPWQVRTGLGPGAVATGMVDEFVWASVFKATQAFEAKRRRVELDDPSVLDAAEKAADEWTFRGSYEGGPGAKLFQGLGEFRTPVQKNAEGQTVTRWWGLPGYMLMPVYKSWAKGMQEAISTTVAPARAPGSLAKAFAEPGANEQARRGMTAEQIAEERYQAAVEVGGRTLMGLALLTAGLLWAESTQEGDTRAEQNVRTTARPPGTLADTPTTRLSPYHEVTQAGAVGRDAARIGRERGTSAAFDHTIRALYDTLINRPLTQGLPDVARRRRDPDTGEEMGVLEQTQRSMQDQWAFGRPYIDLIRRTTETTSKRREPGFIARNYSVDRPDRASWTGEVRPTGGAARHFVFGGAAVPTEREKAIASRIIRVNEAARRAGPLPGEKAAPSWWPAPPERDYYGERFTPEEYDTITKVAGLAFQDVLPRIPTSLPPAQQLAAMREAWRVSVAQGRAAVQMQAARRLGEKRGYK